MLKRMHWSIVIADDHGPEWTPGFMAGATAAPVQYCHLGASRTLLQKALSRALKFAPASNVLVTAIQKFRSHWDPSLWFVRPENRFVVDSRSSSPLATAAALLSIASQSPADIVTLLPARCFVAHDDILQERLELALALVPQVPEGVVTLGMLDTGDGVDESYLLVGPGDVRPGLMAHAYARQPAAWVARYLRQQGAVVASGIVAGYAGIFAAHISNHWPGLTHKLTNLFKVAAAAGLETQVPATLCGRMPSLALRALRWYPPSLAQRILPVRGCGWSGLNSARAVARIMEFGSAGGSPDSRYMEAEPPVAGRTARH